VNESVHHYGDLESFGRLMKTELPFTYCSSPSWNFSGWPERSLTLSLKSLLQNLSRRFSMRASHCAWLTAPSPRAQQIISATSAAFFFSRNAKRMCSTECAPYQRSSYLFSKVVTCSITVHCFESATLKNHERLASYFDLKWFSRSSK